MEIKFKFACGHELVSDVDARVARNRGTVHEAKRNNGVVIREETCIPCRNQAAINEITAMTGEEFKQRVLNLDSHSIRCILSEIKSNEAWIRERNAD